MTTLSNQVPETTDFLLAPNYFGVRIKWVLVWLCLLFGTSIIVSHLKPNPFNTYIKYMISKHILRGRAPSVYRRLTCDQREDLQQVKQALIVAFAPDPFVAFDTFVSRRLHPGETVDEYLGDLQDLARLFEENTSDRWLSCAFVSGLPGPVRRQLRGSSRMEHMTLEQILARVRALMTEETEVDEPVAAAAGRHRVLPNVPAAPPPTPDKQSAVVVQCYKCGCPNHFARDCRQPGAKSRRALPEIRCYQCQQGHVASRCPEN